MSAASAGAGVRTSDGDDGKNEDPSWVLVHKRPESSSSTSSTPILLSSVHILDVDILEPLLATIGPHLCLRPHEEDDRDRVDLRWAAMFLNTCKTIRVSHSSIMLTILRAAGACGDARGVARFLENGCWTADSGVHEVRCCRLKDMTWTFCMPSHIKTLCAGWMQSAARHAGQTGRP
jgi:hypothetical protein